MTDIIKNFYKNNNTIIEIEEGFNVKLPLIYNKLVLSDFLYSYNNRNNNCVIINLCRRKIYSSYNPHIYNILLDDSINIPYQYFKKIMLECSNILKMAINNNYPIIINCAAGINRSSSVIIAYSSLYKKININEIIFYIIEMKKNKYGYKWPTLTNNIFFEYLNKMKIE